MIVRGHSGDISLPATTRPPEEPQEFKDAIMLRNKLDEALYLAANYELDKKIEALGRERIQKETLEFSKYLKIAEACSEPRTASLAMGTRSYDPWKDCYWLVYTWPPICWPHHKLTNSIYYRRDNGCGIKCLKHVFNRIL